MCFHPQRMGHQMLGAPRAEHYLSKTHAVGGEQRFLNTGGFVVSTSVPEELA